MSNTNHQSTSNNMQTLHGSNNNIHLSNYLSSDSDSCSLSTVDSKSEKRLNVFRVDKRRHKDKTSLVKLMKKMNKDTIKIITEQITENLTHEINKNVTELYHSLNAKIQNVYSKFENVNNLFMEEIQSLH